MAEDFRLSRFERIHSAASSYTNIPLENIVQPENYIQEKKAARQLNRDMDSRYTQYGHGQYTALSASPKERSDTYTSTASRPFFLTPSAWLYETIGLGLAIAVLVSLTAILVHFNRNPNPRWKGISLNTVVSIASALFRIFLMVPVTKCISQLGWVWFAKGQRPLRDAILFDGASRGAFGSARILTTTAFRSIVALGSVATIGTLIVGPFFQQCLVFYSELTPQPDTVAYASYASAYNGSLGEWGREPGEQLPYNMKSAVYTGLLSSTMISRPYPPFTCPSGNCTWDPFGTLAVGVECLDISDSVQLNCTEKCLVAFSSTRRGLDWFLLVNDTTDSGAYERPPRVFDMPSSAMNWTEISRDSSGNKKPGSGWSVDPSGIIAQFEWLRVTGLKEDDENYSYIHPDSKLEAGSCHLYTTVQEISASVQNGVYAEVILSEIATATEGPYTGPPIDPGITPKEGLRTYTYHYTTKHGDPKEFSISSWEQYVLLEGAKFSRGYTDSQEGNVTTQSRGGLSGPEVMKTLYQTPNITDSVHNLAYYMSVAIRSNDTILEKQRPGSEAALDEEYVAPSHQVAGTVKVDTIHVLVHWGWLAFPTVLAFLVLILLATTIFETHKWRVGIWKDSPLALLLNSYWEPGLKREQGARTANEIEKDVKGLKAEFMADEARLEGEWRNRRIFISRDESANPP